MEQRRSETKSIIEKRNAQIDKNFIGIFDGYILPAECKKIIEHYENENRFTAKFTRQNLEKVTLLEKNDTNKPLVSDNIHIWYDAFKPFFANFDIALKTYIESTCIDSHYGPLKYTGMKIQKTLPGQGYHVWHIEHGNGGEESRRVLTYLIYLNDIEDGGETELLHQSVRVKPKTGRILIFPTGFPYVHRGNPPLKGNKYILTSWILVAPKN
jgi:hypothetical protein